MVNLSQDNVLECRDSGCPSFGSATKRRGTAHSGTLPRSLSPFLLVTLSCLFLTAGVLGVELQTFLKTHCVKCHGSEKQKGKLRLDTAANLDAETWQAVVDRIADGEMPPEDERQPNADEKAAVLQLIKRRIAGETPRTKQVLLRRLNRVQYRNTIRDLLKIDLTASDPTELFPADDKKEGFDNLGEALQMSDFLLRQYLSVSRLAVNQATVEGPEPEVQTHTLRDTKSRPLNFKSSARSEKGTVMLHQSDERAPGDARGQNFINCREGATHDGWYEFTYEVESRGRGNWAEEMRKASNRKDYPVYRGEDLHRFEIYITAPRAISQIQTRPRTLVAAIDLPDNERIKIKRRIWLPEGYRVEAGFGNGFAYNANTMLKFLEPELLEKMEGLRNPDQRRLVNKNIIRILEENDFPRIVVHNVIETGPHFDQWPPESHEIVTGDLREFATRAFRRPVTEAQLAPYLRLASQGDEGHRKAIEAILCSPRFIYLYEDVGPLDGHAIASRLSYFLWNTMPDGKLLADAEEGRLRKPEVITYHIDRMLNDSRSDEFVNTFVWSWLHLQNTVEMAPDPMKFYDYHRNRINEAMLGETRAFFRHLLTEDLPIRHFVDSNYSFLNADLVRHYGLTAEVRSTTSFQRVALNRQRGGLLGQSSVLTASANGVDTSPVVRGIWMLENLLGTPPSPPPDDVEVPEPDARGDLTIRQLYAKHRTVESCNDCHKKIDPLGFALENFDAVGAWRTRYESGHQVDPSGRMPNGESFKNIIGLKQILLRDLDQFSRNLTTKLLTYATGRTMEVGDRPEIDRISKLALKPELGLRDMVKAVATSRTFLTK